MKVKELKKILKNINDELNIYIDQKKLNKMNQEIEMNPQEEQAIINKYMKEALDKYNLTEKYNLQF